MPVCRDEDAEDGAGQAQKQSEQVVLGGNPFLEVPCAQNAIEYKKGYVMRKCCYESNAKRSEYNGSFEQGVQSFSFFHENGRSRNETLPISLFASYLLLPVLVSSNDSSGQ